MAHGEPGDDEEEAHTSSEAGGATEASDEPLSDEIPDEDADDDFGTPFVPKTFGGAFVWARGDDFVATVLRIKEGKSVPVATANRRDMTVMLTGGRAVLEVDSGEDVDRVELLPAGPIPIEAGNTYRLHALTEVELFTVYSPE